MSLTDLASIAAIISAMCDVYATGRDTFQYFYEKRLAEPENVQRAQLLGSTFDDDELEAIKKRILGCRKRFISEGDGKQRRVCFCSVLTDVKDGNGGDIPVDEWAKMYEQLKCGEES